jgi:hypothetical protein
MKLPTENVDTMSLASSQSDSSQNPLATDLQTLGQLVRNQRVTSELSLVDAADSLDVSVAVSSSIEDGQPAETGLLFKVLTGLGLAMLVMPKSDASVALRAVGHTVDWYQVMARQSGTDKRKTRASLVLDRATAVRTPGMTPHAAGRSAIIFSLSAVGGNTYQQPSSCRKKNSARKPPGDEVSTRT